MQQQKNSAKVNKLTSRSKKKRLCRPFRDGTRFFEKYKDKLSSEAYTFLYLQKETLEYTYDTAANLNILGRCTVGIAP
ncbi:hypothetical protein GJB61_14740 [Paenibacillus sp. LC-T2]|uniref:Uncharacterized protein n=1 Tax=Paenibacillus monticola TaxID=2666075 RepID=A0A7X2H640_9BACL|nr:hypothetical protein [Paenibacillus monticola]